MRRLRDRTHEIWMTDIVAESGLSFYMAQGLPVRECEQYIITKHISR